jgi:hypothetical protein
MDRTKNHGGGTMKKFIVIIGLLSFILPFTASYGAEKAKVLSPYFFVQSEDPTVDPFPLLETKAKVDIAGVIAEIELTQVYKNEGKRTIEAIYCFPLGTKSAIHAMRMQIGDRIIEASLKKGPMNLSSPRWLGHATATRKRKMPKTTIRGSRPPICTKGKNPPMHLTSQLRSGRASP